MDARIRFYRIRQCGYYNRNIHCLGSVTEMMRDLKEWTNGKVLNQTRTYSVDPNNNESGLLDTYCYSVVERNNDFLLTTWNRIADVDGKVSSIDGQGYTGQASVETTEPPSGYIPGYPAFFWFIPEKDLFATIQFNTPLNGRKNLDCYLNHFLEKFSSSVIYSIEGGTNHILGYGTEEQYDIDLEPRFISSLFTQEGQIDYILANRESIRKIIKKDKLVYSRPGEDVLFQNILSFLHIYNNTTVPTTENNICITLEYNPSEKDLKDMIDRWKHESNENPSADIGFLMKGNSSHVFWLKESLASDVFGLDIRFLGQNVLVRPEDLLAELQAKQNRIFETVFRCQNGQ